MKKTGAQLILEVLLEHGVDTVFGYPGGAALNVYDALYEYQDRIKVQAADMARQFQPAVCAHVDIQKRNIELTQVFVRQSGRVAAGLYRSAAAVFWLIAAHQIGHFLAKGCIVITNQYLDSCRHGCRPFRME